MNATELANWLNDFIHSEVDYDESIAFEIVFMLRQLQAENDDYCKQDIKNAGSTSKLVGDAIRLERVNQQLQDAVKAHEEVHEDHNRLVRELDVLLNGDGAAKQASLCDIVAQVKSEKWTLVRAQ